MSINLSSMFKTLYLDFNKATSRMIFLDYDGTLVPFKIALEQVKPSRKLLSLLQELAKIARVVIISGRDKHTLETWFGTTSLYLVAEHGAWLRAPLTSWELPQTLDTSWKSELSTLLIEHATHIPGAVLEEKEYTTTWHFRNVEHVEKVEEVRGVLRNWVKERNLELLEGSKVLEVRTPGITKGYAAEVLLKNHPADFILAIGDDATDEDLFAALPPEAYSVKVGPVASKAKFSLPSHQEVLLLLKELAKFPLS